MKNIFLKKLELYYFKGIKSLSIDFDNQITDISGANGLGKSSIFDAFTWLLFGKDSHDRKDFEIKTLQEDGTPINKVEHTVQATLLIDGEIIILKKIYKENWVKKRGELEPTLSGHEVLCYVNEVPKKVNEYNVFIGEIIDESLFKIITNPKYFASLGWKIQRDILFKISGTVSIEEIAQNNADFVKLISSLNGKSLSDFLLQKSHEKKRLKADLDVIPTRIDEVIRSKPAIRDFSEIEEALSKSTNQLQAIDNEILSINSDFEASLQVWKDKQNEINELIKKREQISYDATKEVISQNFELKTKRQKISNEISIVKQKFDTDFNKITGINDTIEQKENELQKLRTLYTETAEKQFNNEAGKLVCPLFHFVCEDPKATKLYEENNKQAADKFNLNKVKELDKINEKGLQITNEINDLKDKISLQNNLVQNFQTDLENLEKELSELPELQSEKIDMSSIQEFKELDSEIEEKKQILETVDKPDTTELVNARKELQEKINSFNKILGTKSQIIKADERKTELEVEGKKLAQQIADIEKKEYTAQSIEFAMIEESEKRINSLFKYVKFKLFNYLINGAIEPTCEITIEGVPYGNANTASQINAGLDIIDVLSSFYNVSAPIIIDNRESINDIKMTNSQIINLRVSKEPELTIK